MNGRFFGGQKVEAYAFDGEEKFKKSSKKDADDEGEKERLEKFGDWLEEAKEWSIGHMHSMHYILVENDLSGFRCIEIIFVVEEILWNDRRAKTFHYMSGIKQIYGSTCILYCMSWCIL